MVKKLVGIIQNLSWWKINYKMKKIKYEPIKHKMKFSKYIESFQTSLYKCMGCSEEMLSDSAKSAQTSHEIFMQQEADNNCKNCGYSIDRPLENAEERLKYATTIQTGRYIYLAVLDNKFKSTGLCNWCYLSMQAYRYSLPKDQREHMERNPKAVEYD